MNCRFCGAGLPDGAIICGTCGRSVNTRRPDAASRAAAPLGRRDVGAVEPAPGETAAARCPQCDAPIAPGDVFCGECGFVLTTPVLREEPSTPPERTGERAAERFVLQFSTGESVIVTSTGLIGRNPVAQPGESHDQFIVVGDVGKSVSKTHAEFGQDNGWFWVSDRYSTNGTVVYAPGGDGQRCAPDRRYRVPRGGRVGIGDQFFIVS